MDKLIATIPKNKREEIRVALSEYEHDGQVFDMVSARVFFLNDAGELQAGRNGLNIVVRRLPELIAALQAAEIAARDAGLITDADVTPSKPKTTAKRTRRRAKPKPAQEPINDQVPFDDGFPESMSPLDAG